MRQYLRKARVVFSRGNGGSGVIINPGEATDYQMKVSFSITRDLAGEANEASMEIWNLRESTRNSAGRELDRVILEAGYIPPDGGTNIGIIFAGNLRDVEHRREGPDIITRVSCGDGDKALRQAVISKTFPAGTPVKAVVEELHKQFEKEGISRGEWKGLDDLPPYRTPYSMCGSCSREMDRIGRSHRLYWSIQSETLEIIPSDDALGSAVLLTPETGLIGTPTITDNGIRFEALMNPQILPGRRVVVESDMLELNAEGGVYRVSSVTFSGDNHAGDFKVVGTCERTDAGKVDEGVGIPKRIPIPTPRPTGGA